MLIEKVLDSKFSPESRIIFAAEDLNLENTAKIRKSDSVVIQYGRKDSEKKMNLSSSQSFL